MSRVALEDTTDLTLDGKRYKKVAPEEHMRCKGCAFFIDDDTHHYCPDDEDPENIESCVAPPHAHKFIWKEL